MLLLLRLLRAFLLLAILVLFPLALRLTRDRDRFGRDASLWRLALFAFPFAAASAAVSLFLNQGALAGALALPWLGLTLLVAARGLIALLERGPSRLEETGSHIGHLYLAIGGFWLVMSRFSTIALGFPDPIPTLTAIHFHFAGFFASILVARKGRQLSSAEPGLRLLWRLSFLGLLIGIPLLAIGISFDKHIELAGALVLALSLTAFSSVGLVTLGKFERASSRVLSALSCASVLYAMAWAVRYAMTGVDFTTMARHHGIANALGFVSLGLFALRLDETRARVSPRGAPFSRLFGTWRIGPDYFTRLGALDEKREPPRGLVDDLKIYAREDFDPSALDPKVRAFYEDTGKHGLLVRPNWKPGFRFAARLFKRVSRSMGQMNFPLTAESDEDLIESKIVGLKDEKDGREKVRAWIRTFARTGEAIYVAAYSTHRYDRETYMNIAFPLPYSNLTSLLRLEALEGGLLLTSLPRRDSSGDEGVYLAMRRLSVRLPINETIRVWASPSSPLASLDVPTEGRECTVTARHDMWIFGIKCLELDYFIFPV